MRLPLALLLLLSVSLSAQTPEIQMDVDATGGARRLIHAHLTIPADLVGLRIQAGGRPIPWRRDDVNMFAFHIDVPSGAAAIDVQFDFISPPESEGF